MKWRWWLSPRWSRKPDGLEGRRRPKEFAEGDLHNVETADASDDPKHDWLGLVVSGPVQGGSSACP